VVLDGGQRTVAAQRLSAGAASGHGQLAASLLRSRLRFAWPQRRRPALCVDGSHASRRVQAEGAP
jgi:uncharacterized protein YfaP (DUF2135 family)